MASMLNEAEVIRAARTFKPTEVSDATRLARYCALQELPGLIFGIITAA